MPVSRPGFAFALLPAFVGVFASTALTTTLARAKDTTKEECVAANESAQDLQRAGKLVAAHAKLLTCADKACPRAVRQDCTDRLGAVEKSTPTVVLAPVEAGGAPVGDASFAIDGVARAEPLDGTPIPVDPGWHTITVTAAGHPPTTLRLTLGEGEQVRRDVVLKSAGGPVKAPDEEAPPPPHAGAAPARAEKRGGHVTMRWIGWSAVGVGAASAVLGSVFGVLALNEHATLTRNCDSSGSCPATQANYDAVAHQSAYAITSTIAFGFGIAAAGAGTVLVLLSPGGSSEGTASAHALRAQPWIGVGSAGMTGSFW